MKADIEKFACASSFVSCCNLHTMTEFYWSLGGART